MESKSLKLARQFLGKKVKVVIDRPLGSKHPKHRFIYEVNYGYIEDIKAPDGEELDAYFIGINKPLNKSEGIVKAIVHRLSDDDDKLVIIPENIEFSDEEIEKIIAFQEKWFEHIILRK